VGLFIHEDTFCLNFVKLRVKSLSGHQP